jgi:hypothetical protein
MDVELYLIGRKAVLNLVYWKVKNSREEIEKTHSHKVDLIASMKRTEVDLLESLECFYWLEKSWRSDSRRNYQLERLNAELLVEIAELKKTNAELINRVNL